MYDKLRLDGEILERIAPLVIKERYLREQEHVLTEQLAQAGLRTPGEARVVSRQAWERGIAEGVRQGLFGLGELTDGRPLCRYFKEEPYVGLAGGEVIIRAGVCQAQREAEAAQTAYVPPLAPEGAPIERLKSLLLREAGAAGAGVPPVPPGAVAPHQRPVAGRERLRLRFTVPKGKVTSLMGVMNLLQLRFDRLDVTLAAEEGQISEQEYEDKIREAFRQMGVRVQEDWGTEQAPT